MKFAWVLLLLVTQATAQVVVLEDDANDATSTVFGQPAPGYDPDAMDLVSLTVRETSDTFHFELEYSNLEPAQWTPDMSLVTYTSVTHVDETYRMVLARQVNGNTPSFWGQLQRYDAALDRYTGNDRLEFEVRASDNVVEMMVPRESLVDGNGTSPKLGRSLTDFVAEAYGGVIGGGLLTTMDRAPDSGLGEIPYNVEFGLEQTGDIRLYSDQPFRASNGEEATFVFTVEAESRFHTDERFRLETVGVPDGWSVTLPASVIRVESNDTLVFPVVVAAPFDHQHGVTESFILKMTSEQYTQDVGQLELGIRYLAIPQPAGHHDRLWIHSKEDYSQAGIAITTNDWQVAGYMNTLDDDTNSVDRPIPPTRRQSGLTDQAMVYDIFLEPELQLGLDFDLDRVGELDITFNSPVLAPGASLEGNLIYQVPGNDGRPVAAVVATLGPSGSQDLDGDGSFTAEILPTEDGDYLEFTPQSSLHWEFTLRFDRPGTFVAQTTVDQITLMSAEMQLPLNEYRDPAGESINKLAGLSLSYKDAREKFVNPGDTVLFNLTLENTGAIDDLFNLGVNGTNGEWARTLGDVEIFVPTGEKRDIVVAVSVPDNAIHGDIVDLRVTVQSTAEPTKQGLIQVLATVDEDTDYPDEAWMIGLLEEELTTDKKSPGLPIVAVLAALALLSRRR